ncbi:MAG: hypothetical protein NT062_18410 [Proteobacteria bacterium]|nr:hypothetical protein [Pseudomonadota bacterium]
MLVPRSLDMKLAALATSLLFAAGCTKVEQPAPTPAPTPAATLPKAAVAVPVDAAVVAAPDAADNPDPARAGKKTGLTPGELPEVATEDFVRALGGKLKLAAFVDPKRGVYVKVALPGAGDTSGPMIDKLACGDAALTAARTYVARMQQAESAGKKTDDHVFACSNEFRTQPDPTFGEIDAAEGPTPSPAHPMAYAVCRSPHIMEWDEDFSLVFVADAKRGLALIAVVSTEGGAKTTRTWADVAAQLTAHKTCP